MVCKIFFKNLRERAFNNIRDGKKTVEIRANKKDSSRNSINLIESDDVIIFKKEDSEEKLKCTVKRKTLYKDVRQLLDAEGMQRALPDIKSIEEGIIAIESIENYKELISKNGVFAIEIADVEMI